MTDFKAAAIATACKEIDAHIKNMERVKKDDARYFIEKTESPIEAQLLVAIMRTFFWEQFWFVDQEDGEEFGEVSDRICLVPQAKFDPYRIDIAIYHKHHDGREMALAIECDGHQFHEKTKEQAAKDKRRDRFMSKLGWTTLRFTGSEIYNDADACAYEILKMMALHSDGLSIAERRRK